MTDRCSFTLALSVAERRALTRAARRDNGTVSDYLRGLLLVAAAVPRGRAPSARGERTHVNVRLDPALRSAIGAAAEHAGLAPAAWGRLVLRGALGASVARQLAAAKEATS